MNETLEIILRTETVYDDAGKAYRLHSHTRKEQGLFLQNIIRKIKPEKSIEVGLAYGISTLFICEALRENKIGHHYVMDPYQRQWHNIGLKNIHDAGYDDIVDFYEEPADRLLSNFFLKNVKIDFAYLDGSKVFDVVFFNIYILSKIMNVGGVLVLDDCTFPGIKKVVRFLNVHPCFEYYSGFKPIYDSPKRRLAKTIFRILPVRPLIKEEFLFPLNGQNLDFHCIAFKKVKEDTRPWNWYCEF